MDGRPGLIIRIFALGRSKNIRRIAVCLLTRDIEIDRGALVDDLALPDALEDHEPPSVLVLVDDRPDIAGPEAKCIQRIARLLLCHAEQVGHLNFAGKVRPYTDFDRHVRSLFRLNAALGILADDKAPLDIGAVGFRDIDIESRFCQKVHRFFPGGSHDVRDPRAAVAAHCKDDR